MLLRQLVVKLVCVTMVAAMVHFGGRGKNAQKTSRHGVNNGCCYGDAIVTWFQNLNTKCFLDLNHVPAKLDLEFRSYYSNH